MKLMSAIRKCLLLALSVTAVCSAQSQQQSTPPDAPQSGQVLFQRNAADATPPSTAAATTAESKPETNAAPDITDADRSAITITAYDLDARMVPDASQLTMRAKLTLRNDGAEALTHIALQISSTLTWQSATLIDREKRDALTVAQHLLDTDADHTGKANELVLALPSPLAPGASLTLDIFYSGKIAPSAERLARIGASAAEANSADWDAITEQSTALRGFGNVLWYPVAAPQVFLGEGAELFDAIGRMKLRESTATIHLRFAVETIGEPPAAAYFCGRREALKPLADNADVPAISAPGLAVADFASAPLGFRVPSLFIVEHPEARHASLPSSTSTMLAVESDNDEVVGEISGVAERVAPLLQQWLGEQPQTALTLLDHPGQPFEDGPLLVAPLALLAKQSPDLALVHSLTHAWIETGRPWIDEGLAQFFTLRWIEREHGHAAALAQLADMIQPLALVEPANEAGKPVTIGQPLPVAITEVYYRRKAAAVWWMLDGITGDDALLLALQQMRARGITANTPQEDALVFEGLIEATSGKDLHWFFDDWVLHDRGLPDLTIVAVTPRELPAAKGRSTGWLVAVTVRNEGAAVADVPVVVHTAVSDKEGRIRIPGHASTTTRIVVEAEPTEVDVNDGSTPEQRTSTHRNDIVVRTH